MKKFLKHSAGGSHGDEHHEHVTPLSVYLGVFGALIVLTVITVGVSELGIPQPYSLILAMIVACTKAFFVVTFFMHLLWDKRLNTVVFLATIVFVLVFFSLTMVDLLSRDFIDPTMGNYVKLEAQHAKWEACMETGTYESCKPELPKGWVEANPDAVAAHGGDHGDAYGDEGAKDGVHGGPAKDMKHPQEGKADHGEGDKH